MKKESVDITQYEPVLEYNSYLKRKTQVPKTYVNKKTGEVVQIQWHKGKFEIQ